MMYSQVATHDGIIWIPCDGTPLGSRIQKANDMRRLLALMDDEELGQTRNGFGRRNWTDMARLTHEEVTYLMMMADAESARRANRATA